MIQIEYLNGGSLVKHFSDAGYMLIQNETGDKYSEPVDTVPCLYTYSETYELIDGAIADEQISGDELIQLLSEVL